MKAKIATGVAAAAIAIATTFIAPWEGLKTRAYLDIVGVPTVCYGETRGVRMGDSYTAQECLNMLHEGVQDFYTKIDPCMPDDLPAKSQAAFTSLAYNIGVGKPGTWGKGFCSSRSIQTAFANRDYVRACNNIRLFNRAGGKVVRGLENRRIAEQKLCLQGLAESRQVK